MSWLQEKAFDPNKMGTAKGWCLANVAKGFGVYGAPTAQPSAKADMEYNKRMGAFHAGKDVPVNVAVPVYIDTSSVYEHVVADDHGVVYSDGRRVVNGLAGFKVFGWGEYCNGVRVVKWADTPATGFLPAKGYWTIGDNDQRVGELARFMRSVFPAYTPASALGNYYGKNISGAIREFQRRTGLAADGNTGPITYAMLKKYGFKG